MNEHDWVANPSRFKLSISDRTSNRFNLDPVSRTPNLT